MCWIYVNFFRVTCVKLRIRLKNFKVFKSVFARAIDVTSHQLRSTKAGDKSKSSGGKS